MSHAPDPNQRWSPGLATGCAGNSITPDPTMTTAVTWDRRYFAGGGRSLALSPDPFAGKDGGGPKASQRLSRAGR